MTASLSEVSSTTPLPAACATASGQPLLTVIIPVYNEAKTLDELLRRVVAVPVEKQIIAINDGSTDGSFEIMCQWSSRDDLLVLSDMTNRGKGCAIRRGLEQARGLFTIIQDADLEYDPGDYVRLIHVLQSGSADVVLGSRYLEARDVQVARLFRLGVGVLNTMVKLLYDVRLTDEATCYKAALTSTFRRMNLQCQRFDLCPEFIAKACRMGLRIQEVPISYHPRSAKAGKKLRLRDGWDAARSLWRWRKWCEEEGGTARGPAGSA